MLARLFLLVLLPWLAAAQDIGITLGEPRTFPQPTPPPPIYEFSPDGHFSAFRKEEEWVMFWPGHDSYRTTGRSLFEMAQVTKVLPQGEPAGFDNGGAWLYSVFRRGERGLIAFYHAEDHRFPLSPDSKWVAYKSIARCTSDNLGLTWNRGPQILTAHRPKPEKAEWSGLGDHCIVWDQPNQRYICIFQEDGNLCIAISRDPEGQPGSWKKWFAGDFTEPGLGGRATPLPALASHRGGNPSVHWNTHLCRWLIVWHRWEGDLWIASSEDLIAWTAPKLLLAPSSAKGKVWYPTLIGNSDAQGGQTMSMLYADFPDRDAVGRRFVIREIRFGQ